MQCRLKPILFFTLSLSFLFTSILFAQSKPQPAQRWEYKTVYNVGETDLDKLGDEGWELVTSAYQPSSNSLHYTFKRLKPANAPKYIDPNERPKPPASTPTCNLSLAQAPTIRGLRLGMTVDELIELFPGANPNELRLRAERGKEYAAFGQSQFSFDGAQHKDRLDNFNFGVTLFDGRVRAFLIQYLFNNSTIYGFVLNSDAVIEKLAESFNLPGKESWKIWNRSPYLECRGFKLSTDIHGRVSISLEDSSPSYSEKIKQRQEEHAAKKKTEFKP